MTRILLFVVLLFAVVGAGEMHAQSLDALRGGSGAFYTFAEPGDITVEVKVWGAVSSPGLYEVRQGLSLSTLLTLAGGPRTGMQDARSRNTLTVRLYRPQASGVYDIVFETSMEDEILVFGEDPALRNGDVLVVEEEVRQRFSWRDGLSIVSTAGTLVLLVDRIVRIAGN